MDARMPKRKPRLMCDEALLAEVDSDWDSYYDSSGSENADDSEDDFDITGQSSNSRSDEENMSGEDEVGHVQMKVSAYEPPKMNAAVSRPAHQWQMPDLVWNRANRKQPNVHAFRGNAGIQVDVTDFRPINFFELYVNEDLINHFVIQTNLMADQFMQNNPTLPRFSNVRTWVDTNDVEMKVFLGLVFLMELDKKPKVSDYWSINPLHHTPLFSTVMPRNRFQLLLKFWHLNDNTQAPQRNDPKRDRLYKLRPLFDHLFEQFQTVYIPTQDVCVDESLLHWKGRLLFRQYIPLKKARFGIKIYCLCESAGYTYRFNVYTGKGDPANGVDALLPSEVRGFPLTEKIVLHMALPLLDEGYTIWMDKWHTSTRLFSYLHYRSTNACGTLRQNRVPIRFRNERVPADEIVAYRADPLLCIRFHDKKIINILTTMHTENQEVNVGRQGRRRGQQGNKPVVIVQYNANMRGVDMQNKLLQPYSTARKAMKWYKKLAIHLLQIAMLNAYLLYKKASADNKKTFKEFQESVIASLIFESGNHDTQRLQQPNPNTLRLTGRHFPATLKPTATWTKPQARCRVCSKHGKRRDVKTICATCDDKPGLCVDCFQPFHTLMDY